MNPKHQPTITDVGNNIRLWRIIKGHKQGDFANLLSISRAALSNIETGKTDLQLSRMLMIATALNVDIKALFDNPDASPGIKAA